MYIHGTKPTKTCSNKSQTQEVGSGSLAAGPACLYQVLRDSCMVTCLQGDSDVLPRQSVFTTALPPLSSCLTIGPSKDSFSIRSLTSCEGRQEQVLGQSQEHYTSVHTKLQGSHWGVGCKQTGVPLRLRLQPPQN